MAGDLGGGGWGACPRWARSGRQCSPPHREARLQVRPAVRLLREGRGEAGPGSDVDILVDAGESFRPLSVYALGEELREATGKSVDVFELSELDEGPFRERAIGEAIRL